MSLLKGTNSYATVVEGDTFFADRIDVDAWVSATDPKKGQALVTATSVLDNMTWTGVVLDVNQLLAFPRSGTYFDPRLGMDIELSEIGRAHV